MQVIALCHTLLQNSEKTNVKKVLVVCPLNTVLNWVAEFEKWLPNKDDVDVFELVSYKQNTSKQYIASQWHKEGGVMVLGYNMFRILTNDQNKRMNRKMRTTFIEALVDPGNICYILYSILLFSRILFT